MKAYSIGLDIGTNSVGWAVIGEDNQLVRYKKKNMWGARLFDEADKAEGRRKNRAARRRLKRRAQRINFLQQIFAPIVLSVDNGFFIKLNESMLRKEDKTHDPFKLSLQEAGYYAKNPDGITLRYPTIYHLRKALMESNEKIEPRLVYLAIHHIVKYRGNFLYQKDFNIDDSSDISEKLTQLSEYLKENFGFDDDELDPKQQKIVAIIKQTDKSRSARRSEIEALFEFSKTNKVIFSEIIKMILGLNADAKKIFADLEDKLGIEFSGKYEDKRDDIATILGDDRMEFINLLEAIYNWGVLQSVLKGEGSVSQAMINKYDAYAADLKFIKDLFREKLSRVDYKTFFKSKKDDKGETLYYTKYTTSGYDYKKFIKDFETYFIKATDGFGYSYDNFKKDTSGNKSLEKIVEAINRFARQFSSEYAQKFIERLNNGEAFSKQRMSDNGAIPYQLHKNELIKIIENQGKYYPELLEKIDNGDGKQEYKIVRLLEHRIPYYVGPLQTKNQNNSNFAWMKSRADGNITPFNFYQKVDKIASAEAFIDNLTNNCTYLPDKPVLPRHSLLFSEFVVRNELKNLKIEGKAIPIELENEIFNELFLQNKKVTRKMLIDLLKCENFVTFKNNSNPEIEGMAQSSGFTATMQSYVDLTKKVGLSVELEISSPSYLMAENLIKWITVFEDKGILREKIEKEYGDKLTPEQIFNICKLNYGGWARLSRELLTTIKDNTNNSIIDLMRESRDNFMQIISKPPIKKKLQEKLEKYVNDHSELDVIDDIPASPALKRGIRQAKKLVDEIIELRGGQKPVKIYIEMARGGEEGKRKDNRKRQLEKLHNSIEINNSYCGADELKRIKKELEEWEEIDKEKRYLYFLQLGKCAYSGRPINLDTISQECEVEHILPQSMIKDDSLDNKVLVYRKFNQDKSGDYPLDPEIRQSQTGLWRYWLNNKLISDVKFARLIKTKEKFEADKLSGGFIKRQLVETRQISKHVAALFNKIYGSESDVDVVEPVKAGIASEFRDKFDLPKSRTINDFHHAKDAYLNAVLGQYLISKFPNRSRSALYSRYMSFKKDLTKNASARKQRNDRELSFILSGIGRKEDMNCETGEIIDGEARVATIRRTMMFNDCSVTRMTETKTNGELYNATVYKHQNSAKAKISRKDNLPVEKYGGHTSDKVAYMAAVEQIDVDNKKKRIIIKIPIRIALLAHNNDALLSELMKQELGIKELHIVKSLISKYQVIKTKDGSMLMLISQANAGNAKQLRLPYEVENKYVKLQKLISGFDDFSTPEFARSMYYKLPEYANRVGETGNYHYELKNSIFEDIDVFLNEFYCTMVDKIAIYIPFYGKEMIGKLRVFFEAFIVCHDLKQKVAFLDEMLKLTQANAQYPVFEKLDISKKYFKSGTGRITAKTFYLDDIEFYDYSITGLKVKKTKL